MSVFSAISRPSRVALYGRVRRRLQHDGVAGPQRLADLLDGDLEREVPRHDRADDADRFTPDLPRGVHAGDRDHRVAERRLPRVLVDQLGRIPQPVGQRRVELRSVGDRPRTPDLEDELLAQFLLLGLDRLLQLQQAALAERVIGRPQSVSSNARRAASMARCISAFDASATSPMTSSVAGLMLVKVPASPSTSLPSIIIFVSKRTVGAVRHACRSPGCGLVLHVAPTYRPSTESGIPIISADHLVQSRGRQQPVRDQQHPRVGPHRAPDEWRRAVQRLGEPRGEPVRRLRAVLHREPPALVHGGVVAGVGAVEIAGVGGSRVGDDVGVVGTGDQDRDADTERRDLAGHRFAPPLECALDRGIRCGRWHSAHAACAGDQHDAAPAGRPHRRQQRLGQRHRAEDVGREHPLPQAHRGFFDHPGRRDTGVVHQRVRCADRLLDRLRRGLRPMPVSVRSSRTPISRGSSSAAPVASRSLAIPASTDRMAATTRQPCLYRCVAEANPSPREAPVMTTLRVSAILVRRVHTDRSRRPAARPAGRRAGRSSRSTRCPTEYGPG